MQNRIAPTLAGVLLLAAAAAAWEPDVRLTYDGGVSWTSYTSARCLAAGPGGHLHAVWFDDRDGNHEIYTKRSTDGGTTWEADTRLTSDAADQYHPAVAVSGSLVHVVWWDERNGLNSEIYYKRSTNDGVTWSGDTRLTDNPAKSHYPSLAVSGDTLHVVWWDERTGWDIYYKRSTDQGITWSADIALTDTQGLSMWPSVAVAAGCVHVVWFDDRDGNQEVYYKRSTDRGTTWGTDTRLTTANFFSEYPVVAAADSLVHVAWSDNRDGNYEAYYKRSTDYGATWQPDQRLSQSSGSSTAMSLAASGALIHLFWVDNRDGYWGEIYHRSSGDGGATWAADERLTLDPQPSDRPTGCMWDSTVAVLWEDNMPGNWEVYFKRDTTGGTALAEPGRSLPARPAWQITPNPVTGGFATLRSASAAHASLPVLVCDPSGRILLSGKVNAAGGRLDLRGLVPGVYLLLAGSGAGATTTKLVIQ